MPTPNSKKEVSVIPQNQAWPTRAPIMKELFLTAFKDTPIRLLEVGVWYGLGSTDIWLSNCGAGSELFLVDAWAPFSSEDDLNDPGWDYKKVDDLSTDAFLSAYLNTKRLEDQRKDDNVKVHLTRGDASTFLPVLAADSFDFIYVDGDHKYTKAKMDLQQAKRLVKKDFGIICGDDLEFLPTPELYAFAQLYPNRDYIREPHNLHPGVLASVHEEFGSVNMVNGFWWVFCVNSEFTADAMKIEAPAPRRTSLDVVPVLPPGNKLA